MVENKNVVIVNNSSGCGGCFSGCGMLLGFLIFFAIAIYFLEEWGPIAFAVPCFFFGAWGGISLSGVSLDEINAIDSSEWQPRQVRGALFLLIGGIVGALFGWQFGAEMLKEIEDNAQIIHRIVTIVIA